MMLEFEKIILLFFLICFLFLKSSIASSLVEIDIDNNVNKSIVILKFNSDPIYRFFYLHSPERAVLDIVQYAQIDMSVFPINFSDKNLIRCIRSGISIRRFNLRLVFDMTKFFSVDEIVDQYNNDRCYNLVLVFKKKSIFFIKNINLYNNLFIHFKRLLHIINDKKRYVIGHGALILKKSLILIFSKYKMKDDSPIVVAIDAGHGGQDPGAIGCDGLCEKDVTIAIAHKLKKYLNSDKLFNPVLIRNGDYFVSVMDRSEVARKKKANFLVSIHTDASLNQKISGASVWVLSNRRANSEINNLLEHHNKRFELLGGIAKLFTNSQLHPYFNQVVLDLQFNHSQRVGYECGVHVLYYLSSVIKLHKDQPEFSSFGVLCSPDIPSLLIETGFISNLFEEKMLSTNFYQERIASAIYKGIRSYFISCYLYPLAPNVINITSLSRDNDGLNINSF